MVRLVFREDLRLEELKRCLQSSKPVRVALTQRPEVRFAVRVCVCVCGLCVYVSVCLFVRVSVCFCTSPLHFFVL